MIIDLETIKGALERYEEVLVVCDNVEKYLRRHSVEKWEEVELVRELVDELEVLKADGADSLIGR